MPAGSNMSGKEEMSGVQRKLQDQEKVEAKRAREKADVIDAYELSALLRRSVVISIGGAEIEINASKDSIENLIDVVYQLTKES